LHGQHEHQTLLDPATHLSLVDTYGGLDALLAPTAAAYDTWRGVEDERTRVLAASRDRDARLDLITFQLGELEKAAPKPNEDDELAALRHVLASAERVERLCTESYTALYENDGASLADVIAKQEALRRDLADLSRGDERVADLERECRAARAAYVQAAEVLSKARRQAAADLSTRLVALLGELAMEQTRFEVRFG